MKLALVLFTFLTFSSLKSHGAVLASCKGLDSIAKLGERNNSVAVGTTLATVSGNENASNPDYLLVFTYGDDGYSVCRAVQFDKSGEGFRYVDVAHAHPVEKTVNSTLLEIPASRYDEKTGVISKTKIKLRVTDHYPAAMVALKP